jgi:hypothetical protein
MLKEEDIKSNENIAKMQMEAKKQVDKQFSDALGE